jgi:hypothetical protein
MNARLINGLGETVANVVVPEIFWRAFPPIIKLGDRHFAFGDLLKTDPDGRIFRVYRETAVYVVPGVKAAA